MTALEFAHANDNVIVWFAGNGCPAGTAIALLDETALPFDLSDVEGEVEDGTFNATNYKDGPGVHDWRFKDWNCNLIYSIHLYSDEAEYDKQQGEYDALG
jgi:hypothetical protein